MPLESTDYYRAGGRCDDEGGGSVEQRVRKPKATNPSTPSIPPILPLRMALFHSLAVRVSSNVCNEDRSARALRNIRERRAYVRVLLDKKPSDINLLKCIPDTMRRRGEISLVVDRVAGILGTHYIS